MAFLERSSHRFDQASRTAEEGGLEEMNLIPAVETSIDLKFLKTCLAYACLAAFLWIPFQVWRAGNKALETREAAHTSDRDAGKPAEAPEPLSSYAAYFENSPVFGTLITESTLPVIQSSNAELAKDYSLKGVMLLG